MVNAQIAHNIFGCFNALYIFNFHGTYITKYEFATTFQGYNNFVKQITTNL